MRRLLRNLLPTSRIGMALWALRNRAVILDWAAFGMRAVEAAASGRGTDDARTEFRLRKALRRGRRTRRSLVEVRVERGVAILRGRLTPEEHAAVQDLVVGTPRVQRVQDEIVHTTGGTGGRFRRRRPTVVA